MLASYSVVGASSVVCYMTLSVRFKAVSWQIALAEFRYCTYFSSLLLAMRVFRLALLAAFLRDGSCETLDETTKVSMWQNSLLQMRGDVLNQDENSLLQVNVFYSKLTGFGVRVEPSPTYLPCTPSACVDHPLQPLVRKSWAPPLSPSPLTQHPLYGILYAPDVEEEHPLAFPPAPPHNFLITQRVVIYIYIYIYMNI